MASKYQFYSELADSQARQVTSTMNSWTGFLSTAGRLYKYPFEEQLMIHAQRPDAVACAPLETWNTPMNRYVRRGSKGIALIDNTSDKPRLKYVFDYSDTEDGRHNARRPKFWELTPEYESVVVEALQKQYGTNDFSSTDNFSDYIFGLARELSARYYGDNRDDVEYSVEGSFLEEYDEYNVRTAFLEALTVSTAYTLMTRCGVDPSEYIGDEDFQPVFDFNSPRSVYTLGKAVSILSEEVLREIEVTIKSHERQTAAERTN